jgi:hypothetical protein
MKSERRIVVGLIGVFLAGVLGLGMLLARWATAGGLAAVDAHLKALAPGFFVVRLAMAALVVGGWPVWVDRAARRGRWPPERTAATRAWRGWVLFAFVAFEVLLVQHGLARLIRALVG